MNIRDRIAAKIVATGIVAVAFAGELAKQNTSVVNRNRLAITELSKRNKDLEAKLASL